ncbi:MAG: flippase-like domain-containing protein [Actinobacteria bacterium]|nr:MAG: flippase-like domain-containing protein [Actinomycetota bacterium]
MADDTTVPVPRRRRMRKRLLGGGFAVVVVVAVFVFFLPRIADYRDVWDVLKDLSWKDGLLLAAATLLNVVTFAPPWIAALPGLGLRQALVLTQASTALSIVSPAGAAVGMAGSFAMLRSWGFKSGPVGLAVAVTGVWNQLANLTFPIVALALLTAANESHAGLRTTALVGVVVLVVVVCAFVLALSSESRAYRVGELAARLTNRTLRLVRRDPVSWGGESLAVFRLGTIDLLRRRWHVITLTTLVGHLTVFLVLLACIRTIGISTDQVSLVEAFAAWALVRILGALPLTPAGLGFVELGLSGALVAFGASNADAVAATLLYRFLTVTPTLALGLAAAATWRMHDSRGPV